jgi:hypothetical protein
MSTMMRILLVSLLLCGVLFSGYSVLAGGNSEVVISEASCVPSDCAATCDASSCNPGDCNPGNCPRR